MGSKAQIIGQVFVFILAGLVFVLIVGYGYKAIQGFIERSEQVSMIEVRNDFERAVEDVKRQYGSVRKLELRLPSKYDGICVTDPNNCPSQVIMPLPSADYAVDWIVDACNSKSANVFVVPRSLDLFLADISVPSPNYICVPNVGGKVTFRLEGTGRKTVVSSWQ